MYLYYDREKETAKLDTYVNVGNNSMLNDDHHVIYTDEPHNYDMWDEYESVYDLASSIDISEEKLVEETRQYLEEDEDFEPDFFDVKKYIETNDTYLEKLSSSYEKFLDNFCDEERKTYERKAYEIIDDFISENTKDEPMFSRSKVMSDEFKPTSAHGNIDKSKDNDISI